VEWRGAPWVLAAPAREDMADWNSDDAALCMDAML
jgi:hypothetical protein